MRTPISILTYHQIDTRPPRGTPFRGLVVTPQAFARQMALLNALGYRGVSMSGLEPYLGREDVPKLVGITFDDGYANNHVHAMPVLRRYGFSATCYVVSGQVGGTNAWDLGEGVARKNLMNRHQLRDWIAAGLEVGAHSRTHVDLTRVDAATAGEEIAQSRAELERLLETPVRHFCYPYGRHHPEHRAMVQGAGYASATTTVRGRVQAGEHMFALPRVAVLGSTPLPLFGLKIWSSYEDRRRH